MPVVFSIDDILSSEDLLGGELDNFMACNLLFMATVLDKDLEIIKKFESISKLVSRSISDSRIYQLYCNAILAPNDYNTEKFNKYMDGQGFKYLDFKLQKRVRIDLRNKVIEAKSNATGSLALSVNKNNESNKIKD